MSHLYDSEVKFAQAIAKLLKYFNLLDTNIGLCLSHLISSSDPSASYDGLASMTAGQRFDELRRRVVEVGAGLPKRLDVKAFEDWFEDAVWVREARNRFVHGNWEHLPLRKDAPIGVSAPPWMKSRLGKLANQQMTLAELQTIADRIEQVFHRFMSIRGAHGI